MNKIAIVVAMQSEFDLVHHLLKGTREYNIANNACIEGELHNKKILLAKRE